MDCLRHRVLVLINQVLRHVLLHQPVSSCRHPRVYKRRQVQKGRTVKREFVMNELVTRFSVDSLYQ